jgi:serine/threonine-protein kinase RsbW
MPESPRRIFLMTMQLSFEFPADTAILEKIGEIMTDAGKKAGFSNGEIYEIQLAVDEACTNTITHGLKKDPTRTFQLIITWEQYELEIQIRELGEPFELEKVLSPDTDASLENRPVGGLGIYIVRKLMDEVEFYNEDRVKVLRMKKRVKREL